jgi:hypothetical protein
VALQSPYSGAAVGVSNIANFIPELWMDDVLKKREPLLQMRMAVETLPFEGKKGDIIHMPIIYDMAVNDKISQTMVTLQTNDPGEYTISIDKYKESSFMIEDIAWVQSKYNIKSLYTERAGRALANDIDNAILGMRAAVPTAQWIYCSTDGTSSGTPVAINEAAILAGIQLLDEADVPSDGRMLIISPGQYTDMLAINKFINGDYVNGSPLTTGILGTLYGIQVYKANKLKTNSATGYKNGRNGTPQPTPGITGSPYLPTQDSFTTLPFSGANWVSAVLCHPSWCKFADSKKVSVEASRENLYQADAVVMTQIYGLKMSFFSEGCVLIHSAP